jgi:chromosome partitioning protein
MPWWPRRKSSYFALEGRDDLLEVIEDVRQPSNPGLGILRRGKTTTAVNLAAALAMRRDTPHRSQPLSQRWYLVPEPRHDRSRMYAAIVDPECEARSNHPAGRDASEPVRGIALAQLEARLWESSTRTSRLTDKIDKLGSDNAHVIVDCPRLSGSWLSMAVVAATHLLIPIQSSYFALQGETISTVRRLSGC